MRTDAYAVVGPDGVITNIFTLESFAIEYAKFIDEHTSQSRTVQPVRVFMLDEPLWRECECKGKELPEGYTCSAGCTRGFIKHDPSN